MTDYKRRFVEVYEILKNLPEKEFNKIPGDLINLIKINRDSNYMWEYDKSKKITEQNLSRDTIIILSYINTEFILEDEQKMLMRNIHCFNEMKEEEFKRKKFNPKDIFKAFKK